MKIHFTKRSLSLLLSFIVIFSAIPFSITSNSAESNNPFDIDGDGATDVNPFDPGILENGKIGTTKHTPFRLDSVADLNLLANIVNGTESNNYSNAFTCLGYFFTVTKNIGTKANPFKNRIGWYDPTNIDHCFNGSFNGNKNTIYLDLRSFSKKDYVGLFGNVGANGSVMNVNVDGTVTGNIHVGSIVGWNDGKVLNCSSSATVFGYDVVGGIVGTNSGTVKKCVNNGRVTAKKSDAWIGAVVGHTNNNNVQYCSFDKTVCNGVRNKAGTAVGADLISDDEESNLRSSQSQEQPSIETVNVQLRLSKPAIGCRLLRAKVFSKTANVNVTNVRTTWFDGSHRRATKAHLGGKYTAMVSFKLDTVENYAIAENAKVWVWLNGKLVRATKRGDTYTVACSFKKLSICNVLSDIYKDLFWRIF